MVPIFTSKCTIQQTNLKKRTNWKSRGKKTTQFSEGFAQAVKVTSIRIHKKRDLLVYYIFLIHAFFSIRDASIRDGTGNFQKNKRQQYQIRKKLETNWAFAPQ